MSRVLSLLLVPPVHRAVKQRYRAYRRAGTPAFTAGLTTLMVAIGWLLLRFESPSWQKVQAGQSYWFPQHSPIAHARQTRCVICCRVFGCW